MFRFLSRFYIKLVNQRLKRLRCILILFRLIPIFLVFFSVDSLAAEGLPELTEEELERYQFDVEEARPVVDDLSLGQRYALNAQRREMEDLIARRLGVLGLKGDASALKILRSLIERKVMRSADVRQWQGMGVVFGDILAKEFGLHWVSYEDDLGVSKALRWRRTENYVFPVTIFSKRVQFKEKIDVHSIYNKIQSDIESFKAFENNRPVFK